MPSYPQNPNESERPELTPEEESSFDIAGWLTGLLSRRRRWIATSFFLVPVIGVFALKRLPSRYESEASLTLTRPRVSQRLADPFNPINFEEELTAIQADVLSRKRLIQIIEAADLYPKLRGKRTLDAIADQMRDDINIEPVRISRNHPDIVSFRITYAADSAAIAQQVTTRLASLFIEENLKTSAEQSASNSRFLEEQLASAKLKLDQQEKVIKDFKIRNLGMLPEQVQANTGTLLELRMELQGTLGALERLRQQRTELETNLNLHIARLDTERTNLLNRYMPRHPEVVRKDGEIERARALLRRMKGATSSPPDLSAGPDDITVMQIRSQFENNLSETERATKDEQRRRLQLAEAQARLNFSPIREQELATLERDYDSLKKNYTELLNSQLRFERSASIEEQRQGQHFRLIEPPSLPLTPTTPNRPRLALALVAAGLAIGLLLAVLVDLLQLPYRTENELRAQFGIPLVVGVPLILSPGENRTRRWIRAAEMVAASLMATVVGMAVLYVFQNPY
ncbi:MAG: hypothetical protein K2Q23_00690 [Bryobacteraceae bacterium]|nr:hypothetical protein [Bryobacteraceae bacterium]